MEDPRDLVSPRASCPKTCHAGLRHEVEGTIDTLVIVRGEVLLHLVVHLVQQVAGRVADTCIAEILGLGLGFSVALTLALAALACGGWSLPAEDARLNLLGFDPVITSQKSKPSTAATPALKILQRSHTATKTSAKNCWNLKKTAQI